MREETVVRTNPADESSDIGVLGEKSFDLSLLGIEHESGKERSGGEYEIRDGDVEFRRLGVSGSLVKWTRTFLNVFLSIRSFKWNCCISACSPVSVTSLFRLVPLTSAVGPRVSWYSNTGGRRGVGNEFRAISNHAVQTRLRIISYI